jgi:hypothetical protein
MIIFAAVTFITALIVGLVASSTWSTVVRAQTRGLAPTQPTGVSAVIPADQHVIALFQRISQHPARLSPLLEQVHAKDWVAKGAPDTYAAQLASLQGQIQAIGSDMSTLAQHPERMQECMRALFRVQSFHHSLDSLMGGLRRYQNPALADLIQSVAVEDQEDLGKLQDYILELANQREQEYLVVDHEAQRCRSIISKEPVRPAGNLRRTTP